MKRILLLHGYGQTAGIFYTKMAAIRKQCGKDCEFVFVDAPILLKPADLPQNLSTIGAEKATTESCTNPEGEKLIARGWWLRNNPATMEQCITCLRDLVTNQATPYDGVFGFSQGACAAALLTSMLEHPGAVPGFNLDGRAPHPPLKFCIAVAGFRPTGPSIDSLMQEGIITPTLIVIGVNDQIVVGERAQTLVSVCRAARVEKHEGGEYRRPGTAQAQLTKLTGHFIPSKATWRQFFANYILLEDHSMSALVASPNPLLTGSDASTSHPPSR